MNNLIQNIRNISKIQTEKGVGIYPRYVKLSEEVGEVAAAILRNQNEINKSASSSDNIPEELIDVLINVVDMLEYLEVDDEKISEIGNKKIIKWSNKLL